MFRQSLLIVAAVFLLGGCGVFNRRPLLLQAAYEGDTEAVIACLERGEDVNQTWKDNHTALIMATYCTYYETIEILLEAGADPNHETDRRHAGRFSTLPSKPPTTALRQAAQSEDRELCELLIRYGAVIDPPVIEWAGAPHGYPGHCDDLSFMMNLLNQALETQPPDNHPALLTSALWVAAGHNDCDLINQLAGLGADLNQSTDHVYTYRGSESPLLHAIHRHHVDAVDCLLTLGADPNYLSRGRLPLRRIAYRVNYSEDYATALAMIDLLLQHGGDPLLQHGDDPLKLAKDQNRSALELAQSKIERLRNADDPVKIKDRLEFYQVMVNKMTASIDRNKND